MTEPDISLADEQIDVEALVNYRIRQMASIIAGLLVVVLLVSSYVKWRQDKTSDLDVAALQAQINPKQGYALSVSYGDLGPRLIQGGVFDAQEFSTIYENSGNPLSAEQIEIIKKGSDEEIIINSQNAHFLLNFFWAVGLANKNSILTEGSIMQRSHGQVERFASTGGWSIAAKPITEIYASMSLIPLTPEQQGLVEDVAGAIYRPCCDNPTLFPDCNHGMAMLGLLELMATEGASANEMFEAAKYVNAYWFPQQTLETAIYLQITENTDFARADPRLVVSAQFSSGSGAARIHQKLQAKGLLPWKPEQGGNCAN